MTSLEQIDAAIEEERAKLLLVALLPMSVNNSVQNKLNKLLSERCRIANQEGES